MIPSPFHGIFASLAEEMKSVAGHTQKPQEVAKEVPLKEEKKVQSAAGQVALDIYEVDDYYIIKAPIAGVKVTDVDIEVNENVLTIRGVRRQTDDIPSQHYCLRECYWGEFQRSVTLPCSIDARRVKATFNKESILKILVPKEEKIKIVRIND